MPTVRDLPDDQIDPHSRRLRHVIAADATDVTDEQVRHARHAYLANISYVDHHVGTMLDVLEHHGLADDTVVVFTSDHGDMLGERGLWYKMSYFEHSARVPLIISRPGTEAGVNTSHAGLLDLAPTLLDLAGVDVPDAMDGASLVPLLDHGPDPDRAVVGEYLGEGAIAPIFMIRRRQWKFVWSQPDPPQLFDLAADPRELVNLATDDAHAEVVATFETEVFHRWDPDTIDASVRASQQARATVDRALRRGRFEAWDYVPPSDAVNQYMRNHLDLNDVESGRRA